MDYYFFINDERIGKITQVVDKIDRIDDQARVLGMTRTLTVGFDDSLDVDKFFEVGQAFMELDEQAQATLIIADINKNNIIYQSDDFHFLHDTESVITQGGIKEYRYTWQADKLYLSE